MGPGKSQIRISIRPHWSCESFPIISKTFLIIMDDIFPLETIMTVESTVLTILKHADGKRKRLQF